MVVMFFLQKTVVMDLTLLENISQMKKLHGKTS